MVERLFNLFDENRDGKIFWSEFKSGILSCMFGCDDDIEKFIFHFFDCSEYSLREIFLVVITKSTLSSLSRL